MRKSYLLIFSLLSFLAAKGQQAPVYSHFFFKEMMFNPAFTGNTNATNATLMSRMQWIDFKNSPQQNFFVLDGVLRNPRLRVGIDLFSDRKGISNRIGGDLSFAYQLKLGDDADFTAGISAGIVDHTFHFAEAIIENPSDPAITGANQRITSVTASAGIAFRWKTLNIGIAASQIPSSALTYQDNTYGKQYYSIARVYNGSLKYKILLSNSLGLSVTPMVVAYYIPNAPLKYDANLNFEWNDKIWIGATYKSDYAIAANAGFCISKRLKIGYSYDFIIGNIGKYSGMSHELLLNFVFGKESRETVSIPADTTQLMNMRAKADSLSEELENRDVKLRSQQDKVKQLERQLAEEKKAAAAAKENAAQQTGNQQTGNQQTGNQQTGNQQTGNQQTGNQQTGNQQTNKEAGNQNAAGVATASNKELHDGVWMLNMRPDEVNYLNAGEAKPGFYVITGTFYYRDFAETELKRVKDKGFAKAKLLFSASRQFHYVAVEHFSDRDAAIKAAQKLKTGENPDAWILSVNK